jgi:hypothetical protein
MDRLDAIVARLETDGLAVQGSVGQPRPHPLLAEHRQTALALGRLLDLLGLTEPVDERPESRTSVRARRAARARWDGPGEKVTRLSDRRSPA